MYRLNKRFLIGLIFAAASLIVVGCGSDSSSSGSASNGGPGGGGGGGGGSTMYTVGGTVSGLSSGASVVLLDNGGDAFTVTGSGNFTFKTALASGAAYYATVGTQPTNGQLCAVNGYGNVPSANVTNITVTCLTGGGNIVGSWYIDTNTTAGAQSQPIVATFFADDTYILAVDSNNASAGIEFGTYTYNSTTGAFSTACPKVYTIGGGGGLAYGGGPNPGCTGSTGVAAASGGTLTVTFNNGGGKTLTTIVDAANPIVGSWYRNNNTGVGGTPLPIVFTFLSNGYYVMADDGNTTAADPSGQPGIEVGPYTYNATTGALSTTCPPVNTDGAWGLSNGGGTGAGCVGSNVTLAFSNNNNTLTVVSNGLTFTRQ